MNFAKLTRSEIRKKLKQTLTQFKDSGRKFEIVYSTQDISPVKSLYVLDSSFNPPTLAHLRIAKTALEEDSPGPRRLLLLLATQNADKAHKQDTLADRLLMMQQFAIHIRDKTLTNTSKGPPVVDVGITDKAYFMDKAAAIDEAKAYPGEPQQIHLTGFDTFVRIFNAKYYEPDHRLDCLEPFLSKHRLRVSYRVDDEWGDRAAQDQYVQDIADGKREFEGGKMEWASQIKMVEGKKADEQSISSTRARKAAKQKDWAALRTLVPPEVQDVIEPEHMYADE